jgi:thiamine transport system substrate-binding protein
MSTIKILQTPLVILTLLTVFLSGCTIPVSTQDNHEPLVVPAGFTGDAANIQWPDFNGTTLRVLDHGAFYACVDMGARFHELTGAEVQCTSEDDTGSALQRAMLGAGNPEFDVLYGADNLLMRQAVEAGTFQPFTPQLAGRIDPALVFFDDDLWPATPVDHGYIAVNIDARHAGMANTTIQDLDDVADHAGVFVTQDPRTSTPGLGYLLATIAVFGEEIVDGVPAWQTHWTSLFENDVLITSGWTEAYETHFSGGYGVWGEGHIGDRAMVTSYTESPAYEAFYGATEVADVLLKHASKAPVIHQIQTMAILAGTQNPAAAEAWIEFTLTDDFQVTAAPVTAVYPVVNSAAAAASVDDTYGDNPDIHPVPGTFEVADFDYERQGPLVAGWVADWVALCEQHNCL